MHQPNPLAFALSQLAALQHDDPRLSVLTREANLYTTVLREQGLRVSFSPNDLKQMFTRMLDLMQVEPMAGPEPSPEVGHQVDLDELEAQVKRVEGKAPPGPAFKLPAALKREER